MPTDTPDLTHLLSLPAGDELDRWVYQLVLGIRPICHAAYSDCSHERQREWLDEDGLEIPTFSTDIAAAWQIHRRCCDQIFSKRNRYRWALRSAISRRLFPSETLIAWDEVATQMEPVDICHAALEVAIAAKLSSPQPEPSAEAIDHETVAIIEDWQTEGVT